VSRTTAWRKRKLAEAKLEEAATIAGGDFKEELLQMFKAQLREFGEEKEEEQAQAPAMETSLAGEPVSKEKVKTRLRTLVALRARLKCHISKETYYTLSSLAKDLPRFHLAPFVSYSVVNSACAENGKGWTTDFHKHLMEIL